MMHAMSVQNAAMVCVDPEISVDAHRTTTKVGSDTHNIMRYRNPSRIMSLRGAAENAARVFSHTSVGCGAANLQHGANANQILAHERDTFRDNEGFHPTQTANASATPTTTTPRTI